MQKATGRRDINTAGGEDAEFPIVCESCLGPNPYVRMSKQNLGAECKICTRPFTIFRWQPGSGARFKKTEVCQTCAKSRNVCQTCLLDLQFGLPTNVRDTALGIKTKAPTSDINREYHAQNLENAHETGIEGYSGASGAVNFGKADPAGKEMLKKLARADPYYNRSRPHLCAAYAKGHCPRGDSCPHRHELPAEEVGGLSKQNGKATDSSGRKMLSSVAASSGLAPPADEAITSLYFTSIPSSHNTVDALTAFIAPLLPEASNTANDGAGLKSIVPVSATRCAFVNFRTRSDAEEVANKLAMRNIASGSASAAQVKISYGEEEVGVQWGRSRKPKVAATATATATVTTAASTTDAVGA